MSMPRTIRWANWLIVALPLHVALAGIPVIDGANTSQATISALQNVAAVTKQIEQYKTQLEQYQNMLQNTAAPAAYIWSEADQTISKLLAAQDTLSYYKTQAGTLGGGPLPSSAFFGSGPDHLTDHAPLDPIVCPPFYSQSLVSGLPPSPFLLPSRCL